MLHALIALLSRLPLRVHYALSDSLLYPMLYYVTRYRRKIVAKNLRAAFPDKTDAERKQIEKAFYHEFCDIIVEIIYSYRCPDNELKERVNIIGMDEINRLIDEAGGGVFMFTHMGNWEWLASVQQWIKPDVLLVKVYRELKNKRIDKLMMDLREHWGGVYVEKKQVLREMIRLRSEKKKILLGLNSDQKPRPEVTRTWVDFLHQETGFVDGGEVLSRKFGYPVFYAHVTRPQRGYYRVQVYPIAVDSKHTAEGDITKAYAHELEKNILEQPELWLWSHNRWKHKRK